MNKAEERLEEKVLQATKDVTIGRFKYYTGLLKSKTPLNKIYKSYAEYLEHRLDTIGKAYNLTRFTFATGKNGVTIEESYPDLLKTEMPLYQVSKIMFNCYDAGGRRAHTIFDMRNGIVSGGMILSAEFVSKMEMEIKNLNELAREAAMYTIKILVNQGIYFVNKDIIETVRKIVTENTIEARTELVGQVDKIVETFISDDLFVAMNIELGDSLPYFVLDGVYTKDEQNAYTLSYSHQFNTAHGHYTIARQMGHIEDEAILLLCRMALGLDKIFIEEIKRNNV